MKKPKLDQHRSRCHGGFDCIDCSTTFNTPAEYKSHTSCISEAEKYQKSLYKGPKTVRRCRSFWYYSRSIVHLISHALCVLFCVFVYRVRKMVGITTATININKMVAQEAIRMGEVGMEDAVEDCNGANRDHKQQVLMIPLLEPLRGCRP